MNPELIDYTKCEHHPTHETKRVSIDLAYHRLDDVPKFPPPLDKTLEMVVFNWAEYSDESFNRYDFCPGQDTVSFCLDVQGVWEPMESLAVLDILTEPGLVVDAGVHLGYYAALAAVSGCDFVGVEANPELVYLAEANAKANGAQYSYIATGLIEDQEPRDPDPIRLFISDVEGAEVAAVRWARESFAARLVDYALLEVSPCFNDTYKGLIWQLADWGYVTFQVPHKGWSRLNEYGAAPLEVLTSTPVVTPETLDGWRQENCIAIRSDLI